MADLFTVVEGAAAIIRTKRVLYQVPLYKYCGNLYYKKGAGYFGLYDRNTTVDPNTRWDQIVGVKYKFNELGRMVEDA